MGVRKRRMDLMSFIEGVLSKEELIKRRTRP